MTGSIVVIAAVVAIALLFDFANGWHDSANAIATVVSTRVLSPMQAVLFAAVFNFAGAYLSTRVAKTIGGGIVDPSIVSHRIVFLAMLAAIVWVTFTLFKGLPISSSHSLVGGLVGAAVAKGGLAAVKWKGLSTVLGALFLSPFLGIVIGFVMMKVLAQAIANVPHAKVNRVFGKVQLLSSGFMALSHGTNDAQKAMGIITLALFGGGYIASMEIPFWVTTACAIAMALGTALGGWKIIKTLGTSLMNLRPVHGSMAETAAATILFSAAALGVPVSTTHVITTTIMGVGAARRLRAVRWIVGKKILYAWVITLPLCGAIAYLLVRIVQFVF